MSGERKLPVPPWRRLLALCALLGWSLVFVGLALDTTATAEINPASSPAAIAKTYAEHTESIRVGISLQLPGIGGAFFLGYVSSRLRSDPARQDWTGS